MPRTKETRKRVSQSLPKRTSQSLPKRSCKSTTVISGGKLQTGSGGTQLVRYVPKNVKKKIVSKKEKKRRNPYSGHGSSSDAQAKRKSRSGFKHPYEDLADSVAKYFVQDSSEAQTGLGMFFANKGMTYDALDSDDDEGPSYRNTPPEAMPHTAKVSVTDIVRACQTIQMEEMVRTVKPKHIMKRLKDQGYFEFDYSEHSYQVLEKKNVKRKTKGQSKSTQENTAVS